MAEPAIRFDAVTKTFGHHKALDELTLTVAPGEVYGFLGPNGAGKTTAIRVLLNLLRATSGTVTALGLNSERDSMALHRQLAYVPGDVAIWPQLTGGQTIDALLAMRGVDGRSAATTARKNELVEAFALDISKRGRAYSKGNRQKVALIAALAADAKLLIFDEPTSGLDPLMEEVFRDELQRAKDAGATVFLSSHILGEVERVCDTVGIIRDGRLVDSGSLEQMRAISASTVDAVVTGTIAAADFAALPGVSDVTVEPEGADWRITCQVTKDGTAALLSELAKADVQTMVSRPPSLEELFLRYYEADPR